MCMDERTARTSAVMKFARQRRVLIPAALACLSIVTMHLLLSHAGAVVPTGPGMPNDPAHNDLLFRFDSHVYFDIAKHGYSYDGDPASSPNIVFAPLFPLLMAVLHALTGIPLLACGFAIVWLSFIVGLVLLHRAVETQFGATHALWTSVGVAFSTGSFAFSALYAESVMLLGIAVCWRLMQQQRLLALGLASCALGLSRLTPAPMCLFIGLSILWRALEARRAGASGSQLARHLAAAALAWSGPVIYLGGMWIAFAQYGPVWEVFREIKTTSWGVSHSVITWWEFLSFQHMWRYVGLAFTNDVPIYKVLNLVWCVLAFGSSLWLIATRKLGWLAPGFIGYFLLVYYATAGRDGLVSTTRYHALLIPIFLMFASLHDAIARRSSQRIAWLVSGPLMAANAFSFVFWGTGFVQGHWFFF